MRQPWIAAVLLVLVTAAGCNGGQTGGEVGLDDGTAGGGSTNEGGDACDETSTELALDEVSALGFAPEEILAFAAGTHEATLTYDPDRRSEVSLTPDGASTALTLVIEATGAAHVDAEPASPEGGGTLIDIEPAGCLDYVRIEVLVTVTTADGAFDEQLEGTLTAHGPTQATLTIPLDLAALNGSFAVEVLEPVGGEPVQTALDATFGAGLFVGQIGGMIELIGPDVSESGWATYAEWGYGDCETGYAPVDAVGAITPAALVELVNASSPLAITWGDGTSADLALAATATSAALCRELWDSRSGTAAVERYVLGAELTLASSDGRLATTQPITIEALADAGALATVAVHFATVEPVAPSEFEATYGLSGVDFGEHTDVHAGLLLAYTVGDTTSVEGALTVYGIPPTDCVDTPNSACGSPGSEPIEVAPIAAP